MKTVVAPESDFNPISSKQETPLLIRFWLAFLSLVFTPIIMAFPVWACWTERGLGSFYFSEWIPERFCVIPYWHVVGLFYILNGISKVARK